MCWIIVIILIGLLSFLIWASADIGSNIYLKAICRGKINDKVVSLTFDDGPDEDMTPRVLDILKEYGVKATFFLVGNKVKKTAHLVRGIYQEGHTIGNHTYSHKSTFPLSKEEEVIKEIEETYQEISSIIGERPKLFRPPFGVTNPIIGRVVRGKRMTTIGWSIRSLDTISRRSREDVCKKVVKNLHPGAVILLHDVCKDADVLLRMLVPMIQERGYRFVSLKELLDIECYEKDY